MNVLTDTLPSTVNIGGKEYPINTDFRAGIAFEMLMTAQEEIEKNVAKILALYFPKQIPDDLLGAFRAVELFYCRGELPQKKEKPGKEKVAYSFEVDGEAILADFWRYYNIDLSQEGLHWWTFRALLYGLPEKSEFKQRIYYRTCDLKGMSKKERERIVKIRKQIEIKDENNGKMTLSERNAKMKEYIAKRRIETTEGVQ
jgi:hypothetical protein